MLPRSELLRLEPEGKLAGGGLQTVTSVADVAANINGVVSADGARGGGGGVGLTEQGATALDSSLALPAHGDNGAGGEVVRETLVKGLRGKVDVVFLGLLLGGSQQLHGDKLEPLLFEPLDDLTDQSTLDTVGLDGNKGALSHFRTLTKVY